MDTKVILTYRYKNKDWKKEVALGEKLETELFHLEFLGEVGEFEKFEAVLSLKEEITIIDFYVKLQYPYDKNSKVFLNGWQTWSESREYDLQEKNHKLNPIFDFLLGTYGDYRFTNYKECLNSWSYSYVRSGNEYTLFGAHEERDGFVKISHFPKENSVKIMKDAFGLIKSTGYLTLKFGIYKGREKEVFDTYFNYLGYPLKEESRTIGWTSWYNYYTSISEEIIMSNLKSFSDKKIPIEIFQIDDGYQREVGDWLEINDKFPNGMKYIADNVKKCGYKAGLWLAPFVCTKKSNIYKNHYDWAAKDERGKPIKAGFTPQWGGFFYVLDFYNLEFQQYLSDVFSTVFYKWNFDMVKLDFLYAITLLRHKGKTKGEMMYDAMTFIRNCTKDKLVLGCGVPLSSSYKLVDFCRVGSDVGLTWEDRLLKAINYKERVSTVNSLASTIGRRHLNNRVFKNDPDVFIIREKNQKMSLNERKILLYLNMLLGGLVFTSDHIGEYRKDELDMYLDSLKLKNAEVLGVVAEKNVFIEVLLNDKKELFIFNLNDTSETINLPPCFKQYSMLVLEKIEPRDMIRC